MTGPLKLITPLPNSALVPAVRKIDLVLLTVPRLMPPPVETVSSLLFTTPAPVMLKPLPRVNPTFCR